MLTLPPPPTFGNAAITETKVGKATLELRGVSNIEEVQGFCSDATGNNVCRLLKEGYFAEAGGLAAELCRVSSGAPNLLLTCRMSGPLIPADGSSVAVELGRSGLAGQTTKTYTAYRCGPDITGVSPSKNQFMIAGSGLTATQPGSIRSISVREMAQGVPLGTIPIAGETNVAGGVLVGLAHPNLANKVLRFDVKLANCVGNRTANSRIVLFESGQESPATTASDSSEFRMPGASDNNAALHIGTNAVMRGGDQPQTTTPFQVKVGRTHIYERQPTNFGNAITNVTLDFAAIGPLQLGSSISGQLKDPEMFVLGNFQSQLAVSCATRTGSRYLCQVASIPANSGPYQLQIDVRAAGTANGPGRIDFRAYGGGLTEQFHTSTVNVVLDAANTADRAVSALSAASGIVAGTSYSKSEFGQVTGYSLRFTAVNNGPSSLIPPIDVRATLSPLPGDRFGWHYQLGALPVGCTQDTVGIPSVKCSFNEALAPGQPRAFEIPFTLKQHITVDGSAYPMMPLVLALTEWPSCAPACVPTYVAARVSVLAAGPSLDPNVPNNSIPSGTGRQPLTICAGGWEALEPTANGGFQRIRCRP